MQLNDALRAIAQQFDLPADELIAYAAEDTHDGWDEGKGSWISGSVWTVEGQILYALVRALKPLDLIEFGTADGCSATHIAAALKANDSGFLTCIDLNAYAGRHIPDELRDRLVIKLNTVERWLREDSQPLGAKGIKVFDFVYEDSEHTIETTAAVWSWATKHVTRGGAVLSHDAVHPAIGHLVKAGIEQSGAQGVRYYPLDPAPALGATQTGMGFAVWRQDEQIKEAPEQRAEVEQPKRAAKPRKATRKGKRTTKATERQPAPDERGPGEAKPETATADTGLPAD